MQISIKRKCDGTCLYCTDSKGTNICVKVIQWGKLWYDVPILTVSYYGEQAVSFKKVDIPESLRTIYICGSPVYKSNIILLRVCAKNDYFSMEVRISENNAKSLNL